MYSGNPVLKEPPYSGGVWYDLRDGLFKIWYNNDTTVIGCATSEDGIHWKKSSPNVVMKESKAFTQAIIEGKDDSQHALVRDPERSLNYDTTSVWIDYSESDSSRRYKCFVTYEWPNNTNDSFLSLHYSADGIHWTEPVATSWRLVGDHTNTHYNPFRKIWVVNIRYHSGDDNQCRAYLENPDPEELTWRAKEAREGRVVSWFGADRLDPHNPRPIHMDIAQQLYHFDAIAYESVMLGLFSVHQGPPNRECHRLRIPKRNEVVLGYSRDGFHFDRPDRRPFIAAREEKGAWNWGNVQSVGGNCLVVGDQLYFYSSGVGRGENTGRTTGLSFLRRDGFASMGSIRNEGHLTTRPVRSSGKYLLVNTDCDQGWLRVEVLDKDGNVLAPFTKKNCKPIAVDSTLHAVEWKGTEDLSTLVGKPVRFRFHLRLGELYAFWVSPDQSGASYGYVAGGGPGFVGPRDTVGKLVYRQ
jgi:hypothetical protein